MTDLKRIDHFLDREDISKSECLAAMATQGIPVAALAKAAMGSQRLEVLDMVKEFERCSQEVAEGNLGMIETSLLRQFMTLEVLFGELGQQALRASELRIRETLFKLALRAQSQARATAETLGALKNPPVVFARQANVTSGPQQINNYEQHRASKTQVAPNELLEEHQDANHLDRGTSVATREKHAELETMDVQHGAENQTGKGAFKHECVERRGARKTA